MQVNKLETLFTANLADVEKGAKQVEAIGKRIESRPITTKVDADVSTALAKVDRLSDRVRKSDETVDIDADTSAAEDKIKGLGDTAEDAGTDGGARGGKALVTGIVAGLATIPIAGAVAKIAEAAGNAVVEGFQNGLQVEVRTDRLAASTGLDDASVSRLARAAGESYAENFGESIDANLATARRAVQSGLLDPKATQRDAQDVISSLSGVADVLEEDVSAVARTTAQLLKTGLAKNAQEAFDIIVAGQQAGLNVSEDWLDTLNEYGTQARNLGLDAPKFLGLLNQAVEAGARDTDVAADALKEYSIRARDVGDTGAREAFEELGFSADEMQQKVAGGGDSAVDALDQTFDALNKIEDPVKRNAIAVKLFGTQAEDLGDALYAMDLDTAAEQFEDLEGRASRALATLGDNTAGDLETAKRNVEVGVQAIQGALAGAFADDIESGAEFVAENREAVVGFLLDAANAALDFGRSAVEGAAAGTEGFGDFVGEVGPAVLGLIQSVIEGIDSIPFVDLGDAVDDFKEMREEAEQGFAEFDSGSEKVADSIRTNIIENGLDPAQEKLNEFGKTALSDARLSDATKRLSNDIADVGYAADGSKASLTDFDGKLDTSTKAGADLDKQIRGVKGSLEDQVGAAAAAGESQSALRERVASARQAFIDQTTALGLTKGEAGKLADAYGLIPSKVVTDVTANTAAARAAIDGLWGTLQRIDGKTVTASVAIKQYGQAALAGGGPVVGPGTGTSDEVPIAASNGEHMLTANEVAQAGGHGAIYRWRARIRSGLARFAVGGEVGQANRSVIARSRELERAREELRGAKDLSREAAREEARAARTARDSDDRDAARGVARAARLQRKAEVRLERAQDALDAARDRRGRLNEERGEVSTQLRRGEIGDSVSSSLSSALGVTDQLRDLAGSGDVGAGRARSLRNTAGAAENALAGLYRQAEKFEKKLEGARDRMAELRSISDGVASNLSGEVSLGDLARPGAGTSLIDGSGKLTGGAGIAAGVRAIASRVLTFSKKLAALAKAGLKGRALSEVADLGSEQGIEVADQLLADRKSIGALNSAYASLDSASAAAGQAVTTGYYKGGLDAAEGVVDGLEKNLSRLDKQIDKWGDRLGKALAAALGIKARASGGPVTAGSPYLVNEDTPNSELFVPSQNGTILNRAQMAGLGGAPVSITVNAMTPTPGPIVAAVADEVAWQLRG